MVRTLERTRSPRQRPQATGSARELTRVSTEGLWTERGKIAKHHALRRSLQCSGHQDVDCSVLKTDVPRVHPASGVPQEQVAGKRMSSTAMSEKSREKELS